MGKLTKAHGHNWKGGKVIMSNGYIGIRVPEKHHLRMRNGYAYEHKLVAEKILGRHLVKSEIIHHINYNRQDNRPENIRVCKSIAEHKLLHRKAGCKLLQPNQINRKIICACGCGASFKEYDSSRRPRKYLPGHWRKGRKGGWSNGSHE